MKNVTIMCFFLILPVVAIVGWYLMYTGDAILGIRIMIYGALPSGIAVVLKYPQVFKRRR